MDKFINQQIGFASSIGECGALTSYWLSDNTNNLYQFAYGKQNINASWVPGSDCATAWNVASQTHWEAIGYECIMHPTFTQLKPGDIFFISPKPGLSTGHTGIVYSTANKNVTTLEQNVNGVKRVQLLPNENSWSWYNGFIMVVRPKSQTPTPDPNPTKKGENILFYQDKQGKQYVVSSTGTRHITPEESTVATKLWGKPYILGKNINQREVDVTKAMLLGGKK